MIFPKRSGFESRRGLPSAKRETRLLLGSNNYFRLWCQITILGHFWCQIRVQSFMVSDDFGTPPKPTGRPLALPPSGPRFESGSRCQSTGSWQLPVTHRPQEGGNPMRVLWGPVGALGLRGAGTGEPPTVAGRGPTGLTGTEGRGRQLWGGPPSR